MNKIAILIALAMLAVPAMAQNMGGAFAGSSGVDMLGDGIFETGDGAFTFPISSVVNTNVDLVDVGDDAAWAYGGFFPSMFAPGPAIAENNLEIKKNQDSGTSVGVIKHNIESIHVGDRTATAYGTSVARNNVKIVTNQQ